MALLAAAFIYNNAGGAVENIRETVHTVYTETTPHVGTGLQGTSVLGMVGGIVDPRPANRGVRTTQKAPARKAYKTPAAARKGLYQTQPRVGTTRVMGGPQGVIPTGKSLNKTFGARPRSIKNTMPRDRWVHQQPESSGAGVR